MDWILDHFKIVALIALVLGSWAKRRMDVKRAAQEERQARGEMAGEGDVFGPDEGWPQPQGQAAPSVPPPLVRKTPPPLMPASVPPPMAAQPYETAIRLKRQQGAQERTRQSHESKATTTGGASATRTRVSAAQRHTKSVPHAKTGLLGSLHSRKEIRRAILMREILGPPVGLR